MASTLMQFRIDEEAKTEAAKICEVLGIDLPTYLRMSVARLNNERGIPFGLKVENPSPARALEIMARASEAAKANGTSEMTLEEINAAIDEARKSRK